MLSRHLANEAECDTGRRQTASGLAQRDAERDVTTRAVTTLPTCYPIAPTEFPTGRSATW